MAPLVAPMQMTEKSPESGRIVTRAGDRGRTGDVQLGKLERALKIKAFSARGSENGITQYARPYSPGTIYE